MSTLLFGPATVSHGGTPVGDTFGGGSISFNMVEEVLVGGTVQQFVTGGSGTINLFQYDSALDIDALTELSTYAVMTIVGNNFSITLQSSKLLFPDGFTFGVNQQQAFPLKFTFKPDASGNIMQTT